MTFSVCVSLLDVSRLENTISTFHGFSRISMDVRLLHAGHHEPTLAPPLDQGSGAGLVVGSGPQQQVATVGGNVGNRRAREGELIPPRPSLSPA